MAYTPDNPYLPGDPYAYDLKWLVSEVKQLIADYQAQQTQISGIGDAQAQLAIDFQDLKNYVDDYFDNLDVSQEISDKLEQMFTDGYFNQLLNNTNYALNPFFTVNRRGASSYTAAGYTADCWHRPASDTSGHKITIGSIELPEIKGDLYQAPGIVFSNSPMPWTISAYIDGVLYQHTFTPIADGAQHQITPNIGIDNLKWNIIEKWGPNRDLFGINNYNSNSDHVITSIKLEPGAFSTLPSDAEPLYSDELERCNYLYTQLGSSANLTIGLGIASAANSLYLPLSIGAKRATPAITLSNTLIIGKETLTLDVSTAAAWFSFDPNSGIGTLQITTGGGLTPGETYRVGTRAGENIGFSAG